jgi:sterol desaturase/sphingolipid hydroxylase (fatty acid hydroxylase superfamily)
MVIPSFLSRVHHTDEERIERLRRNITTFDRWRRVFIVLNLVAFLALVAAFVAALSMMDGMVKSFGQRAGGSGLGFGFGFILGMFIGLYTLYILHGWYVIFFGLRNERLLIRFYDADRDLGQRRSVESEGDGPIEAGDA